MQLTLFTPMPKRSSKWIEGLKPDTPVSQAARRTLRRRLRTVWTWLKRAAERPDDSVESVHQLRVAVRRASAAIAGYAELLPAKKTAKIEKRLKRIRRRAGLARDCDVLFERFAAGIDAERREPLLRRIAALRREARRPIVKLHKKLRKREFPRSLQKFVRNVRPRGGSEPKFEQWARLGLSRTVDSFFAAAERDLNDIELLHQFRIEGKRLRYALEYFSGAFGPEVRTELYLEIERMQELLGMVNDHASAATRLDEWRNAWNDESLTPLLDDLIADERRSLAAAHQEFFRWWTPQRAADLRKRFDALLRRPDEEHAA